MDIQTLLTLGVALFWALTGFTVLLIIHAILKRKRNDPRRATRRRARDQSRRRYR